MTAEQREILASYLDAPDTYIREVAFALDAWKGGPALRVVSRFMAGEQLVEALDVFDGAGSTIHTHCHDVDMDAEVQAGRLREQADRIESQAHLEADADQARAWAYEGNEDGSNRDVPPFDNDPRTDAQIKQEVYERAEDWLDY